MHPVTITANYGEPIEAKALPAVSGVSAPEPWLLQLNGLPALAGPAVTPASAMSVPVVAACVTLIAGAIGSLPAKVYRIDKGGRDEDPEHPAWALVHDDACPWQDAGQLREQLVVDAMLRGNGYALVLRDDDGTPIELTRLPPEAVAVLIDSATGEPWFRITTGTGGITRPHSDVIHVPAPGGCGADGITGTAPIQRARNAIGIALAQEAHLAKLLRNGARPSGVLSVPAGSRVGPKGAENALASFEHQSTADNSGKPVVLLDGMIWTPTEFKSVDIQFAEQRAAQTYEIARAFNVPPTMIGELAKATLSNSETMGRQFLRHTLAPWLRALRAGYRRALLTPAERRTHAIEFDTSALVQADSTERAAYLASLRASGIITGNEGREAEGYPARPDGNSLASPHTTSASPLPEPTRA